MKREIFITLAMFFTGALVFTACNSPQPQKQEQKVVSTTPPADTTRQANEMLREKTDTALLTADTTVPGAIPLTIMVDNLQSPNAPVEISIYGPNSRFLDKHAQLKKLRLKPEKGKIMVQIKDLAYGIFAIALYQDLNNNGRIDKNMLGLPKEPYAFSNNFKPTIKLPAFNDCKFAYNETTNTVNISLLSMSEAQKRLRKP